VFKQFVGLSLIALGLVASGCTEAPLSSEEIGENEEALCSNGDGVNSVLAALAASAAKELGRWNPTVDFAAGTAGSNWYTTLTSTGKARCSDGKCWNTQALLDLQKAAPNAVRLNGVILNANNLVSQLTSNWNAQKNCELRGGTGDANCSAELHKLVFKSQQAGSCDTIFTYDAKNTSGGTLVSPGQLKNKLLFNGGTGNPFLAFTNTGTTVSIDPTYGLEDDGTTSTGACTAACTKISSATNVVGACCTCNGATKKYAKSAWSATTYLCQ